MDFYLHDCMPVESANLLDEVISGIQFMPYTLLTRWTRVFIFCNAILAATDASDLGGGRLRKIKVSPR
jgi:hypothetical protein